MSAEVGALRVTLSLNAGEFERGARRARAELDSFAQQFERVSDRIRSAGLALSAAITAPLAAIGGLSLRASRDFEKGMGNIATLVDTNVENMAKMGDAVLAIGRRTPVAFSDLAIALYDIRSAGVSAADSLDVLERSARLSVAGLGTVKEAAGLVTSAINAFGLQGQEAANVYDVIMKTIKSGKTTITGLAEGFGGVASSVAGAKIKFDEYLSAVAALTSIGLPAAQAHTQIRAAVAGLTRDSTDLKKVLAHLGAKSFKELVENSGGMVAAFMKISAAVGGNDAKLIKLLGSVEAYNAVMALAGKQNKMFAENLILMRDGTSMVDAAFEKQNATMASMQQRTLNAFQAIGVMIGAILAPAVEMIASKLLLLTEWFRTLSPETQTLIVVLGAMAAAAGPLALAIGAIGGAISALLPVIGALGVALAALLGGPLGVFIAAAWAAVAVWLAAEGKFGEVFQQIAEYARVAFNFIVSVLQQAAAAIEFIIEKIGKAAALAADVLAKLEPASYRAGEAMAKAALAAEGAGQGVLRLGEHAKVMGEAAKTAGDQAKTSVEGAATATTAASTAMEEWKKKTEEIGRIAPVNLDKVAKAHATAKTHSKEYNDAVTDAKRIIEEISTPMEKMAQKQEKINNAMKHGKLTVDQYKRAMADNTAFSAKNMDALASHVSSNLGTIFGETKGVAIATALINTYQGITKALATYPPPMSLIMAGISLAAGLAQVARIKSQNKTGGGSSGGGGEMSASAGAATSAATQAAPQQTLTVQGLDTKGLFTGSAVRDIAERLLDYQRDGGRVVLA